MAVKDHHPAGAGQLQLFWKGLKVSNFLNGEAELDLSVHEMDVVNRILRVGMTETHDLEMVNAFLNLNVDFKAATGLWSGVFVEYLRDQQS